MSLISWFVAIILTMVAPFAYSMSQEKFNYKDDEVIIRFRDDTDKTKTLREKKAFLDKKGGGKIIKSYKRLPNLHVIKLPKNLNVEDALKKYRDSKEVMYVEPNYKIYLHSTIPNDPYFPQLWGLHNTGQEYPIEGGGTYYGIDDADIDATEAWDIYTGNQEIIVAVLDSGIDYNHPDLSTNMWVNQAR